MDWLSQNWIWILVFAAFIGMHLFGHGHHGGHGHGRSKQDRPPREAEPGDSEQRQGHHH